MLIFLNIKALLKGVLSQELLSIIYSFWIYLKAKQKWHPLFFSRLTYISRGLTPILFPISLPRQAKIIINSADKISFSKNYSLESITHFPSAICRASAAGWRLQRRDSGCQKAANSDLKTPKQIRNPSSKTHPRRPSRRPRIVQGNPEPLPECDTCELVVL